MRARVIVDLDVPDGTTAPAIAQLVQEQLRDARPEVLPADDSRAAFCLACGGFRRDARLHLCRCARGG